MAKKQAKNEQKPTEKKLTLQDLLGSILTKNVNLLGEEYKQLLRDVTHVYDKNNETKAKRISLEERRQRIASNFYGTTTNFLFQIMSIVSELYEQWTPLLIAIAEKVGVKFEEAKTSEEKAMDAVAEYLNAKTKERKGE